MPRTATKATDTIHPGGGFDKATGYQEQIPAWSTTQPTVCLCLKAHGPKAGSKNRPRSELEPVATINDVVQEEVIVAGLSLYEVCTKCGNLFTNLDSLNAHNAIHRRVEAGQPRAAVGEGSAPGPADSHAQAPRTPNSWN